jgi:hypothetical protein
MQYPFLKFCELFGYNNINLIVEFTDGQFLIFGTLGLAVLIASLNSISSQHQGNYSLVDVRKVSVPLKYLRQASYWGLSYLTALLIAMVGSTFNKEYSSGFAPNIISSAHNMIMNLAYWVALAGTLGLFVTYLYLIAWRYIQDWFWGKLIN